MHIKVQFISYRLTKNYVFNRLSPGRPEPGQLLFQEDEPADGLYIIIWGMAKVTKWAAESDGVAAVLSIPYGGNSFGEVGLVDGLSRSSNGTVMGTVDCYFLYRAVLGSALEENHEIALPGNSNRQPLRHLQTALPSFPTCWPRRPRRTGRSW